METSLREFAEFQDADEVLLFERATFLGKVGSVRYIACHSETFKAVFLRLWKSG
jgi:hypothetical protein